MTPQKIGGGSCASHEGLFRLALKGENARRPQQADVPASSLMFSPIHENRTGSVTLKFMSFGRHFATSPMNAVGTVVRRHEAFRPHEDRAEG